MKKLINNLKYKFEWVRVYFSPFKFIVPKLYVGKIAIGVPYFFPRTLRNYTKKELHEKTLKDLEKFKELKKESEHLNKYFPTYNDIYKDNSKYQKFVNKTFGWDFVGLGWKTKWSNKDYRLEYNPVWSLVFFKWQIALIFCPIHSYHYWECWLYYSRNTDKKLSVKKRIEQARKEFPCIWISKYGNVGMEQQICYWDLILKKKHL